MPMRLGLVSRCLPQATGSCCYRSVSLITRPPHRLFLSFLRLRFYFSRHETSTWDLSLILATISLVTRARCLFLLFLLLRFYLCSLVTRPLHGFFLSLVPLPLHSPRRKRSNNLFLYSCLTVLFLSSQDLHTISFSRSCQPHVLLLRCPL